MAVRVARSSDIIPMLANLLSTKLSIMAKTLRHSPLTQNCHTEEKKESFTFTKDKTMTLRPRATKVTVYSILTYDILQFYCKYYDPNIPPNDIYITKGISLFKQLRLERGWGTIHDASVTYFQRKQKQIIAPAPQKKIHGETYNEN